MPLRSDLRAGVFSRAGVLHAYEIARIAPASFRKRRGFFSRFTYGRTVELHQLAQFSARGSNNLAVKSKNACAQRLLIKSVGRVVWFRGAGAQG